MFSSCGQTTNKALTFDAISSDICECTKKYDSTQSATSLLQNCWNNAIKKYKKDLAKINVNSSDTSGSRILYEEITKKRFSIRCSDFFNIALKENEIEMNSRKSFTGIVISEIKLKNGQFETEVKSTTTMEVKKFITNTSFKNITMTSPDLKSPMTIIYKNITSSKGSEINKVISIDGWSEMEVGIKQNQ